MTCVITAFLLLSLQLFWKPRRNSTLSVFWISPPPPGYCSAGRLFLATDVCYSSSIKHLSHTQTDSIVSELFNKHLQTANDNIIYKATKIVLSFRPFSGFRRRDVAPPLVVPTVGWFPGYLCGATTSPLRFKDCIVGYRTIYIS